LVGHFNRWLEQKHLTAEQLDEDVIELYRRHLKRRKRVRSEDACTLVRLLDLLREQGATPRNVEATPTAREILLEKYRRYLREERGLAEASQVVTNCLALLRASAARFRWDQASPARYCANCRRPGWRAS
jgi:hypothetical protein